MAELEYGRLVALDATRLVFEATHRAVPLLVAQPYNGSHWQAHGDVAAYVAAFADEQRRLLQLKEPLLPHVYGGCFSDLQSTRVVREYVALWPAVCADARLDVDARLQIAANALELARWFDAFPLYRDGTRRRVVATRLHAGLVAVSAFYVPKLLAIDALGLEPYDAASALLADEPCVTDHDCSYALLVERGFFAAFKAVATPPQEFRCNMRTHRCFGLDASANLMAICRLLLEPLLGLGGHRIPAPLDTKREHLLASIVTACQFGAREDRPSIDELQSTLRGMIGVAVPPFMTPRNPDIAQFFQLNATHEQIANGDAAAGLLKAEAAHARPLPPPLTGDDVLARLADVVRAPSSAAVAAAAAHPHSFKLNVTRWWFDFARTDRGGHEARSLMTPPIRLFGFVDDHGWASSPVYSRLDTRRLLTHSGSVYRVDGKLDCASMLRRGFSKAVCAKFADGFPDDWATMLVGEYERQFADAATAYYARYAPPVAIDFRYTPPALSAVVDAVTTPTNLGAAHFRDAVDDEARSGGDGGLQCVAGELGCICRAGLCVHGAQCVGNMCMPPPPQHASPVAADPLGVEAHALTAEQIFSLRVLVQSAPCAATSANLCEQQRTQWRDPSQPRAAARILAPCQWVREPAPGRCVHAEHVRFVDEQQQQPQQHVQQDTGKLHGEIVPPKLPPHVVPLVGAVSTASAEAQPRCVTTHNAAQDVPVTDVSARSTLVEQTIALRLNRAAGVELAVGVSQGSFGAQLTKYAAVARIRRDGVVEAATGGGRAPRADLSLALHADVYYALRFVLDLAHQNFSLAVIDAHRNGGVPQLIARDVPFLSDSRALGHVGILEMTGGDGAIVCVYQPIALPSAEAAAVTKKPAPSLRFDVAAPPPIAMAPVAAKPAVPRTACCGNACTCCLFERVKWDVLAFFAERYGLRPADCSMHDEVRQTFCRSTPQFSCAQTKQEQCLFACKNE